jgi:hypothetical protein
MLSALCLAFFGAFLAQTPAPGPPLTLELRIFSGTQEVTSETAATVHRAGDRGEPVANISPSSGRIQLSLPPGFYDVQAIHLREGRVIDIRWANRLVLMPYPDEGGHHLEVLNFKNGFGALQVRGPSGAKPDVALFEAGKRDKPVATPLATSTYQLFVVRAGSYDILSRAGSTPTWHAGIEVPLDRTRLWVTP